MHGTQRRRQSETAARRVLPAPRRPGKGRTARRRRVGERPRGSRGGGPTGRRQGRGRPSGRSPGSAARPGDRRGTRVLWVSARRGRGNAQEGSGPVSFSVYCFLDLELERRRPRDYKPSPRVCAEEPRGLRGWLQGSRAPRSPRLLWTATPAEPLFLKLGRFADLSRKFFLVPGTLARLLSSAECVSATLLSQKKRVKVQLVEISPFSSWKRV